MIEVTDEMVGAFMAAAHGKPVQIAGREVPNARAGLAAVLAIVERDIQPPPRRVLDEINAGRRALPPGVDERLRAALWTCSTFSLGDLHDGLRAAGFVHVEDLEPGVAP